MAQKSKLFAALAASVCLLSACGMKPITSGESSEPANKSQTQTSEESTEPQHTDTTDASDSIAEMTTTAAETTGASVQSDSGFPKGVYWGVGSTDDWYYEFHTDNTGKMVYQSMGATLSFEYARTGNRVTFYIGSRDNAKTATISDERENRFTLSYDGGDMQVLTLQEQKSLDDFSFYSTAKLIEMLRTKYKAQTGKSPDSVEKSIDKDGMIVIKFVWEDSRQEPYIATLDRFTAKGFDGAGKKLDLTPYA